MLEQELNKLGNDLVLEKVKTQEYTNEVSEFIFNFMCFLLAHLVCTGLKCNRRRP
jgi:hypothetical protein